MHCCINPTTPAVLSSGGRQFAEGLLRLLVHPVQGKVKDKYKYNSGCWCTQGNVKDVQVQSWKICANKQADQVDKPQVGLQLVFYAILYNYPPNPYNCNFFMQLFFVAAAV